MATPPFQIAVQVSPLSLLLPDAPIAGSTGAIQALAPGHQAVALKIAAALLLHVEEAHLGQVLQAPCNVRFARETIVQPDILFVRHARGGIIGDRQLYGVPDLVIEVLSPSQRRAEFRAKKSAYSRFGVPELWTIDLALARAETAIWSEMGYICTGAFGKSDRLSSATFPHFSFPIARIY